METEYQKIDTNGGGQILFSEFIEWALDKNLDLEDDIDYEEYKSALKISEKGFIIVNKRNVNEVYVNNYNK